MKLIIEAADFEVREFIRQAGYGFQHYVDKPLWEDVGANTKLATPLGISGNRPKIKRRKK